MTITLEQAEAVIRAHHESRKKEMEAAGRKLMGRLFKHHQRWLPPDSDFTPADYHVRWWLYARVTSVNDWGSPSFFTFERNPKGVVTVREAVRQYDVPSFHASTDGFGYDWTEIGAAEFWGAAMGVVEAVTAQLTERR